MRAGLTSEREMDMAMAANEVLTNALRYGRGAVAPWGWPHDGRFLCQIQDDGPGIADPLAGYLPPATPWRPAEACGWPDSSSTFSRLCRTQRGRRSGSTSTGTDALRRSGHTLGRPTIRPSRVASQPARRTVYSSADWGCPRRPRGHSTASGRGRTGRGDPLWRGHQRGWPFVPPSCLLRVLLYPVEPSANQGHYPGSVRAGGAGVAIVTHLLGPSQLSG